MYSCVCAAAHRAWQPEADVRCLPPSLPTFPSEMPSARTTGKHTVPLALSTASSGIIARNHQSYKGFFLNMAGKTRGRIFWAHLLGNKPRITEEWPSGDGSKLQRGSAPEPSWLLLTKHPVLINPHLNREGRGRVSQGSLVASDCSKENGIGGKCGDRDDGVEATC